MLLDFEEYERIIADYISLKEKSPSNKIYLHKKRLI